MLNTKRYSEEFKIKTLELAQELRSVRKAAKQQGVSEPTIYEWRNRQKYSADADTYLTVQEKSVVEEARRLRQEVADLKKINRILVNQIK